MINKNCRKHNICVKRWGIIPLFSIKVTSENLELLLFKFIPLLKFSSPGYEEIGGGKWELM